MKLIVFDLDFTLWNAGGTWCDHTFPPYRKENGYIYDSQGNKIFLYADTKTVLTHLISEGYDIAIASRTHEASWAEDLLRLFSIEKHFKYKQIFPGSKVEHFKNLREISNKAFEQMVFFDDEMRNISEVGSLGVKAVFVDNGITKELVFSSI